MNRHQILTVMLLASAAISPAAALAQMEPPAMGEPASGYPPAGEEGYLGAPVRKLPYTPDFPWRIVPSTPDRCLGGRAPMIDNPEVDECIRNCSDALEERASYCMSLEQEMRVDEDTINGCFRDAQAEQDSCLKNCHNNIAPTIPDPNPPAKPGRPC